MATLTKGISLREFALMSEPEKLRRVSDLVKASRNPTPEQLENKRKDLNIKIRVFESRYKMASDEMLCLLKKGQLTETADICSWVFLTKLRDRLESKLSSQPVQSSRTHPST